MSPHKYTADAPTREDLRGYRERGGGGRAEGGGGGGGGGAGAGARVFFCFPFFVFCFGAPAVGPLATCLREEKWR